MEGFMVAAECDGEVWRTRLLRRNPRKLPGASDEDIVSLMRIGDPVFWAEIGMNWEPDILCLNNTGRENTVVCLISVTAACRASTIPFKLVSFCTIESAVINQRSFSRAR
ncbi:hypothetical protein WN944_016611 [Citrus x changshan-huyou]|uniref:Uncharacterized protein n=1 Tax=Citrus x changshan-huyou TaxID=2935761 RepID=A0AAP0QNR2_9ROSI